MTDITENDIQTNEASELDSYKARVYELELSLQVLNESLYRELNAHHQTSVQLKHLQAHVNQQQGQ